MWHNWWQTQLINQCLALMPRYFLINQVTSFWMKLIKSKVVNLKLSPRRSHPLRIIRYSYSRICLVVRAKRTWINSSSFMKISNSKQVGKSRRRVVWYHQRSQEGNFNVTIVIKTVDSFWQEYSINRPTVLNTYSGWDQLLNIIIWMEQVTTTTRAWITPIDPKLLFNRWQKNRSSITKLNKESYD